ncbi:MAG: preprotein translocase subunit SecA [Candidatus Poribacteria bacterium]|nr:preprotein translocase subunit SecA [Candidatus Poribacteria bacterium]
MFDFIMNKIVGTKNDRDIKKMRPAVDHINRLGEPLKKLGDAELYGKTAGFKQRLENGESVDDLMYEAFAVVRETAHRVIGERPYDVQLMGAMTLHAGKIAEMKTGEGKTLTSTLPIYLNGLTGKGVHVVTVNEFLAQRDADWMGAIFKALGLTVGVTLEGARVDRKQAAYACDVTYGTNSEFGFDYLRDNSSARHRTHRCQGALHYAIVDEVDSILIDEARTPHIISQQRSGGGEYVKVDRIIRRFEEGKHYELDEKRSKRGSASLIDDGIDTLEREFAVENLFAPENIDLLHVVTQSLNAHALYRNDVDYVVQDDRVIIVDENTGRMQPERRFGDGLHQALEAKENVKIVHESQTVARITFQNYFRLYEKLAGMTGTAATEAPEFHQIYGLDVIVVPTNEPICRDDKPDFVYRNMKGKMKAVVEEVKGHYKVGRPVLLGTASVESSVAYHKMLTAEGIPHRVLNAKEHEKEGEIILHAGQKHAITIATNMAGRGVDIKLGQGVRELGGLVVIGTDRHDSRRIDNQLRGRSGRQGDPGLSRFYLSLEDELMRKFMSDGVINMMDRLGMEEDVPIEHKMVTRAIEKAQERVEQNHFEGRKQILKYDMPLSKQREMVYDLRNRILDGDNLREDVMEFVENAVEGKIDELLPQGEREHWDLEELGNWVTRNCGVEVAEIPTDAERVELDELRENLVKAFHRQYDLREQQIGSDMMREVERLVLLDRIDHHWMEHLHNIDYIQEGIGFRGYAGKDPAIEFQREAFGLFQQMLDRIHEDVSQFIFRVHIQVLNQPQDAPPPDTSDPQGQSRSGATKAAASSAAARLGSQARAAQNPYGKVGRNEPCPCGSGKKFKQCHGRLG